MTLLFRKYFWTINLVTISLCALLAAKAVGRLVEANLPTATLKRAPAVPHAVPRTHVTPQTRDITSILDRNIFCSTCQPESEHGLEQQGDEEEPASNEPTRTSLKLQLIATLVSNQDKAWSFAAIINTESETSGLFAIGSKLPVTEDAVVTDIMERRVLLLNRNRNEYLDLEPQEGSVTAESIEQTSPRPRISATTSPVMPEMEDISKGIRKVDEGKYEIDRNALNKVLANTTLLARSARIVPSVSNGKPNGFKLYAIRPGSLYSLLGMFNGDTINAINGHPITTPDKALEVYTKLRSASHVSISFTRRGKTNTHEYTIR